MSTDMNFLQMLADPAYVAKFQRFCGVELEKPLTCDQQTQTRRNSPDSDDSESNGESEEHPSKDLQIQEKNHNNWSNGQVLASNCDKINTGQCPQSETVKQNGYSTSQVHHRTVTSNNNQEEVFENTNKRNKNQKKNVKSSDTCKIGNENQNGKLNYNGSHIIEPNNRIRSKGNIVECNGHTKDESSTNKNVLLAPSTNQTVRVKYKFLLYLAQFGAFLGNEEFYLTFFPFTYWNLDSLVVRQVSMLWSVAMYLGQATKDYLRWPRPPSPPVARLESHHLQEYSMPSTHAMAGTAIPLFLAYLLVDRYQVPVVVAATMAVMWYSVTCLSRLYLGVHTILDLVAGTLYAVLIFFTFMRYVKGYDLYQQTHPFAAAVILFTALALCTVLYPSDHKNSSKGDAVQIVAAFAGSSIGAWLGYQLGYMHGPEIAKPYLLTVPTLSACGLALLRFMSGLIIVAAVYVVTRLSTIRFFSHMYGLDKPDKTSPSVMTAYKFTTYTIVGIVISFFVPLMHMYFGIHRTTLFCEVS